MNAQLINQVVAAVDVTFDAMLGFRPVRSGKPYLRAPDAPPHEVTAVIGLAGATEGAIAMGFALGTAEALARRFLGSEDTPGRSDVLDSMGELVNIIAGALKAGLGQKGTALGLPRVLEGEGDPGAGGAPSIAVPFETEWGPLLLEFRLAGGGS